MVEMFVVFSSSPVPTDVCVFFFPTGPERATLYPTDQSADAVYRSMPKTSLPALELCFIPAG